MDELDVEHPLASWEKVKQGHKEDSSSWPP